MVSQIEPQRQFLLDVFVGKQTREAAANLKKLLESSP
jgi:hypothetical protein